MIGLSEAFLPLLPNMRLTHLERMLHPGLRGSMVTDTAPVTEPEQEKPIPVVPIKEEEKEKEQPDVPCSHCKPPQLVDDGWWGWWSDVKSLRVLFVVMLLMTLYLGFLVATLRR